MNPYLKNLSKIEFVLTYACTGRCKHCSEGDHSLSGVSIDPVISAEAVRKVASEYAIKTVMVFGGEPLLCLDAVESIMRTATELGVERRQIITNGFFSRDVRKIREVAKMLGACGVNDLLLSVDAFHQETIALDTVRVFADALIECGVPVRLQPAWLVSTDDENSYNVRTREILAAFSDLEIPVSAGNIIFPEGNAKRYLAEYFEGDIPENPYEEDPNNVTCLSFSPNGDVLGSNVYRDDIMEIIENYRP